MADKKYPVGTPIKYIGHCRKCKGNTGEIIQRNEYSYRITLPHSSCNGVSNGTLECSFSDVEPLIKKNEQLLFSFMDK